ncbi:MAG: hypothetical protein QOD12_310 [Verrucomicrobiota bacterium]
MVVLRFTAVDDDVGDSTAGRQERKGCCRINRQSGTERHHEISLHSGGACPLEFRGIKALAEADRGRLQKSSASAQGWFAMSSEILKVRFRIIPSVTVHAFDQGIRSVQLDQTRRRGPGELMQTIDVLRDHHEKLPCLLEPNECMMDGVGLSVSKGFPSFQFVIPMLDPCCLRRHEILEEHGLAPRPYSLRSAEIRNPASR